MTIVVADRVKETTISTGTGTITLLGAYTGYTKFIDSIGNGNSTYYCITHALLGTWEVGIGLVTSPNLLTRTTVLASSNGTSLVNFGIGVKDVFVTAPAKRSIFLSDDGLSLNIPGAVTASVFSGNGSGLTGISSSADWNTLTSKPTGIVSSSTQATTWTVATASLANSVAYVNITGKPTIVSSSTQATTWTVATASLATTASYAVTASYAANGGGASISSSYAVTASYATIAQNVLGSITSASYAATASYVEGSATGGITGSFSGSGAGIYGLITSSYSVTSSYVEGSLTGGITGSFSGSGVAIYNINATNIQAGTLSNSRLPTTIGTNATNMVNLTIYSERQNGGNKNANFTVDWSLGNSQKFLISGSATASFASGNAGGWYTLEIQQDSVGNRELGFVSQIKFPPGSSVTAHSASNAITLYRYYYNGTNFLGNIFGAGYV